VSLAGDLAVPRDVGGLVLFAHRGGGSHRSPDHRHLAEHLNEHGLATLLVDLEERAAAPADADVDLCAERLLTALGWLAESRDTRDLGLGLFGSGTGGAVALIAAAECPSTIRAVVTRDARPDLADAWLAHVEAPTLLLVGPSDDEILGFNGLARERIKAACELEIVAGDLPAADHGGLALEQTEARARTWFLRHL
jgi:putative phosphoribosyl transferase